MGIEKTDPTLDLMASDRALAGENGDKGNPAVGRATAVLGEDCTVTVTCPSLTLERFIAVLEQTVRRAKKAQPIGIELSTFLRILKDQAKSGKGSRYVGLSQE